MSRTCNECAYYSAFHGMCCRKGHNHELRRPDDRACGNGFLLDPMVKEDEEQQKKKEGMKTHEKKHL